MLMVTILKDGGVATARRSSSLRLQLPLLAQHESSLADPMADAPLG